METRICYVDSSPSNMELAQSIIDRLGLDLVEWELDEDDGQLVVGVCGPSHAVARFVTWSLGTFCADGV